MSDRTKLLTGNNLEVNLSPRNEVNVNITSGARGKSAYETWLELGYDGSEQDFIDYLRDVDSGLIDYEGIDNKPSIEQIELIGNRELRDFGITIVSEEDIINLF